MSTSPHDSQGKLRVASELVHVIRIGRDHMLSILAPDFTQTQVDKFFPIAEDEKGRGYLVSIHTITLVKVYSLFFFKPVMLCDYQFATWLDGIPFSGLPKTGDYINELRHHFGHDLPCCKQNPPHSMFRKGTSSH